MRISDWSSDVCSSDLTLGVGCSIVNPATAIGFVSQGLVILPFRPRIEFEYLLYTPSFRALSQTALRFIEIMTVVRDEMVAAGTFGEPPVGPGAPTAEIGSAHVCTPVTNAPLVCRLLLDNTNNHTNLTT